MNALVVTGASGFLGRALISALPNHRFTEIRALEHQSPVALSSCVPMSVVRGDVREVETLRALVSPGATVIHLAYLAHAHPDDNLEAARNLLAVCREVGVRRLIHCSTAVVAGRATASVVNESTPCQPFTLYEQVKFALERLLSDGGGPGMEVVILRPTAIFGPGGRNLVKLAEDLLQRPGVVNYAAACLQGDRRMNLVHVDNVTAALRFLIDSPAPLGGETYIVSDDESPLNNYRDVEQRLAQGLGIAHRRARIVLPRSALRLARRIAGRPAADFGRIYDGSKIVRAGLRKPMPFEQGLEAYARWYLAHLRTRPE